MTLPSFPAGALLMVADLTSTSATVRWPAASDDVGVDRYEVALDGAPQPTLNGQTTEIQFSQLRAMGTYLVTVRAYDAANNPSPELIITINTPDGGPPTWGNAQLVGTAGINEVELSWDAAIDDVAVASYRLYQGGQPIYEGAQRQFRVGSSQQNRLHIPGKNRRCRRQLVVRWPTTTVTTAKAYDPGFKADSATIYPNHF